MSEYQNAISREVIDGLELVRTCYACPEQYNVLLAGESKQVAYFRLRHGYFYAACPDVRGEVVYSAEPKGDGIFEDEERYKYLNEAVRAVWKRIRGDSD